MLRMFMPAIDLSSCDPRSDGEPALPAATINSPGLDFAKAIRSLIDFTGSDGCAATTKISVDTSEIGAKSVMLYGTFAFNSGKTQSVLPFTISVYPSGGDLATASPEMMPPARLSTITGCPN